MPDVEEEEPCCSTWICSMKASIHWLYLWEMIEQVRFEDISDTLTPFGILKKV